MNLTGLCSEFPGLQFATPEHPEDTQLVINVVYTSPGGTLVALEEAAALASDLKGRIALVAAHAVPIAFPVDSPPVSRSFLEQRLLDLAAKGAQGRAETSVRLYLCRNPRLALRKAFGPRSLVIVGCSQRWWPRKEQGLARMLRLEGHQVILVKSGHGGFNAGSFLSGDRRTVLHSLLGLH
jgi:hypothetical protein